MYPVLQKTFGSLSKTYYIRQFLFGLIFPALFALVYVQNGDVPKIDLIIFCIISAFLYPYARFVYESIFDFIIGGNVFYINGIFGLVLKVVSMLLCWGFSIFIAPLGLAYLYFYHNKQSS